MDVPGPPQRRPSSVMMLTESASKSFGLETCPSNATTPARIHQGGLLSSSFPVTPEDRGRSSRSEHDLEHPSEPKHLMGEPTRIPSNDDGTMTAAAAAAAGKAGGRRNECGTDRLSLDTVVDADNGRAVGGQGGEEGEEGGGEGEQEEVAAQAAAELQNEFSASASVMIHIAQNVSTHEAGIPPRVLKSSRSRSRSSISTGGAGVVEGATALGAGNAPMSVRCRETDGSGHASPVETASTHSSTGVGNTNSVRGREKQKEKEQMMLTMTWEAFLAQHTEVGKEEEEEEGGRLADDETSARTRRRSSGTRMVQQRLPESPDPRCTSRYPVQTPTALVGSRTWMDCISSKQGDEGDGEEAVPRGPGAEEIRPRVPHVFSDLDVTIHSRPGDLEFNKSHSLSPKGMQQAHDIRIGPDGVVLSPSSLRELGMADGFSNPGHSQHDRSSLTARFEDEINECVGAMRLQKIEKMGVNKFNVNPKDGLNFLMEQDFITDTPEGICDFLSIVNGLSKRRLGEYFGRDNPVSQKVLSLFLKRLQFSNLTLDEALRAMVLKFRMPGEAQQIDRIMERFSERYHEENPGVFSCSQTAYILAFSLMMLNTDMYNRNLKETEKMTQSQFVSNNRGIDRGLDLPQEQLEAMYQRVQEAEIRMREGDMFESEVITFVAPKKSGWLNKKGKGYVKKWNRYWFVLADAVLYYFLAPQHQDEAPRCIIPLENVNIDPVGSTDLTISLKSVKTMDGHVPKHVKSVKMMGNGQMEKNNHRSFIFRAETQANRDEWVHALRVEVPQAPLDLSVTSGSLAGSTIDRSYSKPLSATPATSSAAAMPFGTPSESGRRLSKLSNLANRKRRTSLESSLGNKMHPPMIRGWARTKSETQQTWRRRYVALFRSADGSVAKDAIYFFGDPAMCDKMVGQSLHASHSCLPLGDVYGVRQETSDMDHAIALQTNGKSENSKEHVIVPEEQSDFSSWLGFINEYCSNQAQHMVMADNTPFSSIGGETTFLSNATIEEHEQDVPAVGREANSSEAALIGLITATNGAGHLVSDDDDVVKSSCGASAPGLVAEHSSDTPKRFGKEQKDIASVDYSRAESHDTQPPEESPSPQELNRLVPTPSTETEPDLSRLDLSNDITTSGSPQSRRSGGSEQSGELEDVVVSTAPRSICEDSTAGTDVE